MIELIILSAGILGLIMFSYSAGKNKTEKKITEANLNAITKAIEARGSIKSGDDAKQLLLEYRD